jgi:D-arabinose 1-dehydrogenase-like Zn-dependent alcohol dehydrogenase
MADLPSTQSGYRIHSWGGSMHWEEFAVPTVGQGEVLVDVEACGIGLTVLNCINGDLGDDESLLPRVPGHEFVGRVVDAGAGAESLLGRRVAAYFYLSCGECRWCMVADESRCDRLAGQVGVHRDGGYAPYAVLPALNAVVIPDELDGAVATLAPDAVATPVHIFGRRAPVDPRDRVAVIGAGGGLGIHAVQVAALRGARTAGLEVDERKLADIESVGAIPVASGDLSAVDPAFWPDGPPTVVVDFVGSPQTLDWSLGALDTGGRLVVVTTFKNRTTTLDPRPMVFGEQQVSASRYASRSEVAQAAALLAQGRIRPILGAKVEPDGIEEVHEHLRAGRLLGRGAVSWR